MRHTSTKFCFDCSIISRYKPPTPTAQVGPGEDLTPDYMNILGMIFSMCGLMMRVSTTHCFL